MQKVYGYDLDEKVNFLVMNNAKDLEMPLAIKKKTKRFRKTKGKMK